MGLILGRTEFSELAICDDQSSKRPQPFESLVAMLLSARLIDGGTWDLDGLGVKLLGLPDKVLKQVPLILG